jgi:hypothetical protein
MTIESGPADACGCGETIHRELGAFGTVKVHRHVDDSLPTGLGVTAQRRFGRIAEADIGEFGHSETVNPRKTPRQSKGAGAFDNK